MLGMNLHCALSYRASSSTMKLLNALNLSILLVAAMIVESKSQTETQIIYQNLKDALIADGDVFYVMQQAFFLSQSLSQDLIYLNICVTVGSEQPASCNNSSLSGGHNNLSYCQRFQWSSSALVEFISIDQLLIMDNVISESLVRIFEHRESLNVSFKIDTLPCESTEDDILAALMQLLPWVCRNTLICA